MTRDGVPLRVLHPGRRGRGAGPDVRDALIALPSGAVLRGDVELHVRASDFRAHGHGRDTRYDGLVLHVVFEDDAGHPTRLANGRTAPVVALAPWVRRRAGELAAWLRTPALWREPCQDAIARLGRDRVLSVLEDAGQCRFEARVDRLAWQIERLGPGEALHCALLSTLGGGTERPLFAGVAERLPWSELAGGLVRTAPEERIVRAEGLLLGAGGLLPSQQGRAPSESREVAWESAWGERSHITVKGIATAAVWPAARRPANHPARRLAGLARLIVRHGAGPDGPAVDDDLLEGAPTPLIEAWTAPAEGYWGRNLAPGQRARRVPGALIGRGRAIELLINAVLPWLAARKPAAAARALACYARLPRPDRYGALAFLEENLASNGPFPLGARGQQGLLHLYKTECTQGHCGRCPLS